MAEQNNQAERAALDMLLAAAQQVVNDGLEEAEERAHPCDVNNNEVKASLMPAPMQALYHAVNAFRRAALPAAVDAEGLPPPPKPVGTIYPGNYWTASAQAQVAGTAISSVYTTAQVEQIRREAIAADRRKQSTLQALYDAGQDIEASGKPQSIGGDAEFMRLLDAVDTAAFEADKAGGGDGTQQTLQDAVAALITYIDGRSAPAAGTVEKDAAIHAVIDHIADTWPMKKYTLEEIESRLRAEVAAIEAHNKAGKEQG